jgi:hypothetical protein
VPIRIVGNASTITVRRAAATEVEVRLGRGAATAVVDGHELDAAANKPYQTPHFPQAAARYAIEVTARLSTVQIETIV